MVEWNEAGGRVSQHSEVWGRRRSHGERAAVRIHLVVDQTPLFQESVDPDGSDNSWHESVSFELPVALAAGGGSHRMMAHTSPVRFRRQEVEVRYSCGLRRYVSIMKLR